MSGLPRTISLGEALPEQIMRCIELLEQYNAIGPSGKFGATRIKEDIQSALKALATGELVDMMHAHMRLEAWE